MFGCFAWLLVNSVASSFYSLFIGGFLWFDIFDCRLLVTIVLVRFVGIVMLFTSVVYFILLQVMGECWVFVYWFILLMLWVLRLFRFVCLRLVLLLGCCLLI